MNADNQNKLLLVMVRDEYGLGREDEPVEIPIGSLYKGCLQTDFTLVDETGEGILFQVTRTEKGSGRLTEDSRLVFLTSMSPGSKERPYFFRMKDDESGTNPPVQDGIKILDPVQKDGFRRLNTDSYMIELCRGTANGTTGGKWGIRYFEELSTHENLILDYSNAIGGVFGPFFTPENGFINPPEHAVADITVEEEGPLLCRYRFHIQVPDGLDPALHDSEIDILWSFFYKSRRFDRIYKVSEYETMVDRMPVSNKITVGDEFEGGQGRLLFSRFGAWPETVYHGGDLYSDVLIQVIGEALKAKASGAAGMDEHKKVYRDNVEKASYDWYWKLLCIHEDLLDQSLVRKYLAEVRSRAGEAVRRAIKHDGLKTGDLVDVGSEPTQTAFVRWADKTVMTRGISDLSVVWYTSQPVRRYQIIQRPQSGWVNWGTNGENEYPELPSGSTIRMACGHFSNWFNQAKRMESPVMVDVTEQPVVG